MKRLSLLLTLILITYAAAAQVRTNSIHQTVSGFPEEVQLPEMPDSLKAAWYKVDSVRTHFNREADSLQTGYRQSIRSIESQKKKIKHKIDSLSNLRITPGKYGHKLDSLNQKRTEIEDVFNGKVNDLKSKTIGQLDKIEMTPEMEQPVAAFTQKINGFSISSNDFVSIQKLQVPGYSLPKVDALNGISSAAGKITGIGQLPEIETPLGNVGEVAKQAEGLNADMKSISQGNINDVKQIPETLEQQATRVEGIDELQKSTTAVEAYKEKASGLNDPGAMKSVGVDMVRKEATNHFAGKEQQLRAAMDKMSKYKQKYSSVQSIKELPKRIPNAMKGKPFVERVVPGLFLQFQSKNVWLLDVNPYAGYRISGRLTMGIGWNQRIAYNRETNNWPEQSTIFGPRAFADITVGKGFMIHLEQEAMYTHVPTTIGAGQDGVKAEWVWSTMLGLKKQYKIYKNLNGTVLIQYNLTNQYFKTPYLDRLNSRMGFEYTLKKNKRKQDRGLSGKQMN